VGDGDHDTETRVPPATGRNDGEHDRPTVWPPAPPWGTRASETEPRPHRGRDLLRRLVGRLGVLANPATPLVVVGALCVAGAVGLAVLLVTASDEAPRPAADEAPTRAGDVGGAALGDGPPAVAGNVVTAPDGSFAITLPPEWRAGFADWDLPPVGEQLYPDDPVHGREVEQLLPPATGETQMFALVPTPSASGSPIPAEALQVDRHLATGTRTAAGAVDYIEEWTLQGRAQILDQGTFATAQGPVVWVEFQIPGDGFVGFRYLTTAGDWEWTITYWTRSPAGGHTLGDQMVASLTPGEGGR
jgi:hypothetical protein